MRELVGPALVRFGPHGHHGFRIVLLVLLAIAAVAVVVLVYRRRSHTVRHRDDWPPLAPIPGGSRETATQSAEQPAAQQLIGPGGPQMGRRGQRSHDGHGGAGTQQNVIQARSLTKRYGMKLAVDDLSFEVKPGHVTGFLGPNGAGKSTTMRLIMGLDVPDSGTVTVNGRRYHDLSWPLHEVGALLEANAIHPGRTAFAHLWMLARANRIPRRRVREVLDLVGLSSVARERVGGFSLGMSQRLGIAVALLGDPGVLMFDEPVNGLLRRLASEGRSVLVSSHLMSEMALTADQLVVIGKGRLIAEMPIDEFTSRNAKGYVRVRSPQLDQLRPALQRAGATVVDEADGSLSVRGMGEEHIGEIAWKSSILLHELAPRRASLEEAFVESTEGDIEYRLGHPQVARPSPDEGGP